MGIAETLVIYAIIGIVFAAVLWVAAGNAGTKRSATLVLWFLFWPLFAPAVLGGALSRPDGAPGNKSAPIGKSTRCRVYDVENASDPGQSRSTQRIEATTRRFREAVASLKGHSTVTLQPQLARIDALVASLAAADQRLNDMERLRESPEFDMAKVAHELQTLNSEGCDENEPRRRSLEARRENIRHLNQMRDRTKLELERALAKIEEISSAILLLQFVAEPEQKLARLLQDIGRDVDALSRVFFEMREL